jgi:hypothetical protein
VASALLENAGPGAGDGHVAGTPDALLEVACYIAFHETSGERAVGAAEDLDVALDSGGTHQQRGWAPTGRP